MLFLLLLMFFRTLCLCVWPCLSGNLRVRDGEKRKRNTGCMYVVQREEIQFGDGKYWDARSLVSDLLTAELGPAQRSSLTSEEYSGVIV